MGQDRQPNSQWKLWYWIKSDFDHGQQISGQLLGWDDGRVREAQITVNHTSTGLKSRLHAEMICFPTPTHHSTGQLAWRSHQELPPTHLSAPQEGIKSGITLLYDIIPQSRVGSQFSSLLVFRTPAFRMVPPTTDWAFPCQSIKTCSQVKLL